MVHVARCPACGGERTDAYLQVRDHLVSGEEFTLARCTRCSLVITQNHPTPDAIAGYYETGQYISHAAGARSFGDHIYFLVRRYMLGRKRKMISRQTQGRRLLDIGAGAGHFVAHLRHHGWDAYGVEPGRQARAAAELLHGLSLDTPDAIPQMPACSFDVVTMWHVLEHVHEPQTYLEHVHRLLTDDGLVVIAVPNPSSYDAQYYGRFWAAWDVPRHLWHFSRRSMETLLDRSGFRITASRSMPFDAFYVALRSEQYRRRHALSAWVWGAVLGLKGWLAGMSNVERASSVMYFVRKK